MTLSQIDTVIASYLGKEAPLTVADLTVNGMNLARLAQNQARREAEMNNDFSFQRQMLTLTVDSVAGGALSAAVIQGTSTTVNLKTIVEMGTFDDNQNFLPIEWTTVEESQERQRQENRWFIPRYPTDAQYHRWPRGQRRAVIRNGQVYLYPTTDLNNPFSFPLGIEAYIFSNDWLDSGGSPVVSGADQTSANGTYTEQGTINNYPLYFLRQMTAFVLWFDPNKLGWVITSSTDFFNGTGYTDYYLLSSSSQDPSGTYTAHGAFVTGPTVTTSADSTSDIWTTYASQYLIWQSIVELNQRWKFYVPRTEGNLGPPTDRAMAALQSFIEWDINKFEQFRRHGR